MVLELGTVMQSDDDMLTGGMALLTTAPASIEVEVLVNENFIFFFFSLSIGNL